MATTIAAISVLRAARVLTYPVGFVGHAAHGCDGCKGIKGDCTLAVAATRDVASFTLADGRSGAVQLAVGATDAQITAAVRAWATANPPAAAPLVGTVIA